MNPAMLARRDQVSDREYELGRPLTSREREVLSLFAEGLGTDEIARRMLISRVTVRNYSQRILAKLGVHSRLAAVACGRDEGLLSA